MRASSLGAITARAIMSMVLIGRAASGATLRTRIAGPFNGIPRRRPTPSWPMPAAAPASTYSLKQSVPFRHHVGWTACWYQPWHLPLGCVRSSDRVPCSPSWMPLARTRSRRPSDQISPDGGGERPPTPSRSWALPRSVRGPETAYVCWCHAPPFCPRQSRDRRWLGDHRRLWLRHSHAPTGHTRAPGGARRVLRRECREPAQSASE